MFYTTANVLSSRTNDVGERRTAGAPFDVAIEAGWASVKSAIAVRQRAIADSRVVSRRRRGATPQLIGHAKVDPLVELAWGILRDTPSHVRRSTGSTQRRTRSSLVSERSEPKLPSNCLYGRRHKY